MTNKTEALKLALSVLDEVRSETFRLLRNGQKLYAEQKVWNAIFIIKQALADSALDRMAENARELGLDYEPPCKTGSQCTSKCQQCEQPAQQQEPVAYSYTSRITGAQGFSHHPMPRFIDSESWDIQPLYTAPQSKPWVGLTSEEIDELDRKNYGFPQPVAWRGPFARAVEAKLKERNA